jgi:hypothetical protein
VIRFQTIVTAFMLAAWLPASSHSLLEYAGLIHERHADHADHDTESPGSHEHNADHHEAADGKYASASPHVSVPQPDAFSMALPFCALGLAWVSEFHVEPHPSGLAPPGTAPPQLSRCWQFSFRAALAARAPTLIS